MLPKNSTLRGKMITTACAG